jgi:hypothetical protein
VAVIDRIATLRRQERTNTSETRTCSCVYASGVRLSRRGRPSGRIGVVAESESGRRRRRRRKAAIPAEPAPAPAPTAAAPRPRRSRDVPTERGLRDLVGAGRSQLGVSGALRGRDVNRPTDEDLAEAERDVVVVRRHWKPPPGAPR